MDGWHGRDSLKEEDCVGCQMELGMELVQDLGQDLGLRLELGMEWTAMKRPRVSQL